MRLARVGLAFMLWIVSVWRSTIRIVSGTFAGVGLGARSVATGAKLFISILWLVGWLGTAFFIASCTVASLG